MSYVPPLKDMLFVMNELAQLAHVNALLGLEDTAIETVKAVVEESARFCSEIVAPLNVSGDRHGATWKDGQVHAAPGFADAFKQFAASGWQGLAHPAQFDGQDLPALVATPCVEMLNAASLSFALCPILTDWAIEALLASASAAQKASFIPRLIAGKWTATMALTEPQAGSDLALVRTKAEPQADGTYRVSGTKCFITWGDHDMAENIVHLVLARTPDAPPGVKGISLFLVPKFHVNDDHSVGRRNDVYCVSIEHKLGIHGSPTALLQFGDANGAVGYLVGEENRGLEYMFVMMSAARFAVGLQGVAVSDRAYQQAVAYAKERVQSRPVDGSSRQAVTIIHHPDVRRMLGIMRALTEANRALAYVVAAHRDMARGHPDESVRARHQAIHEFLLPVFKGWATEASLEVTSLGIQVHGGMGFMEETGAAQHLRDARILPIYEGTTGIQANDLVGRKTLGDNGTVVFRLIDEIKQTLAELVEQQGDDFAVMHQHLQEGVDALQTVVDHVLTNAKKDVNAVFAGSVLYLKLTGIVLGGWQMARAMLAASRLRAEDPAFYKAKIATARFYAEHVLPRAVALRISVLAIKGGTGILALAEEQF